MNIKKLFQNEKEYIDYFNFLLDMKHIQSLWNPEDYPKLEPFFNASRKPKVEWTDEINNSFDFYMKCNKDYADERSQYRDSLSNIDDYDLAYVMGFDVVTDLDNDDAEDEYSLSEELKFPLLLIGSIDSGFDRSGNFGYCSLYKVNKEDLE